MSADRFERPAGPSRPAAETEAGQHDEPAKKLKDDVIPDSDVEVGAYKPGDSSVQESRAIIRLKVEQLLRRREPAPIEHWQALGQEGLDVLTNLLDERDLGDDLRHTTIATLGQLGQASLAERLGPILLNGHESALTRTYAASALGRLGGGRAVAWLGRAVGDQNDMVRRQIARSLRRIGGPVTTAFLRTLSRDQIGHVADEAKAALTGDIAPASKSRSTSAKPKQPEPESHERRGRPR